MKNKTKDFIQIAMVAAVYAVFTVAISPFSYGAIQLRFSEILVLLCFYNKKYCISLTLGCAIANIFSPMALFDIPFGTLATLLSVIFICKSGRLWIASLFPTIFNAVIVGAELYFALHEPFMISMATVALGEFIVVTVLGVPLFRLLEKNTYIMRLIGSTR